MSTDITVQCLIKSISNPNVPQQGNGQTVIHPYCGRLLVSEKERGTDTHPRMTLETLHSEKEARLKAYTLYGSIYMTLLPRPPIGTGNKPSGCWGRGKNMPIMEHEGNFCMMKTVQYLDYGGGSYVAVNICRSSSNYILQRMNFTVRKNTLI